MNIVIKNYTKQIKNNFVLKNINYEFKTGNIYGLIGKNGSGKTMLLKAIASFLQPTEGNVYIDNIDIYKKNYIPNNIGVSFSNPDFMHELSGYENLEYLANIRKIIGDEEIKKAVSHVNLVDDIDKKVKEYSLGMKQKLELAQAFMENPKILLLDEPFNGLDKESIKIVKNYLKKIKNDTIIIIATHYKEDIEHFCDIIVKLENGEIIK